MPPRAPTQTRSPPSRPSTSARSRSRTASCSGRRASATPSTRARLPGRRPKPSRHAPRWSPSTAARSTISWRSATSSRRGCRRHATRSGAARASCVGGRVDRRSQRRAAHARRSDRRARHADRRAAQGDRSDRGREHQLSGSSLARLPEDQAGRGDGHPREEGDGDRAHRPRRSGQPDYLMIASDCWLSASSRPSSLHSSRSSTQ